MDALPGSNLDRLRRLQAERRAVERAAARIADDLEDRPEEAARARVIAAGLYRAHVRYHAGDPRAWCPYCPPVPDPWAALREHQGRL